MLMGREGRKRTTLRDRMFLPDELSKGLSQLVIRRDGLMVPLLANPVTVVESTAVWQKTNVMFAPISVFSFSLIIVLILGATLKSKLANNIMDIILFFLFSVLAVMIFFFNFFTDHVQMRGNLHILWLSPFVITSLIALILDKRYFMVVHDGICLYHHFHRLSDSYAKIDKSRLYTAVAYTRDP